MNQTFNTWFQLNKGAVIGDVGHAACVARLKWVFRGNQIPWIFLQLLHTKGDTVCIFVDLDHLNLDCLADGQNLGGVVHTAPCHVCDVKQAVNAAEVNKRTVFGDVLDHAVDFLALGQVANDFCTLLGTGFFEDRTTRNNDVTTATVHFQNLERLLETHQRASSAHGAHINLRARQERNSAAQINSKAAFNTTKDRTFNALFSSVGFLQTVPCFLTARHLTGDNCFAFGVFDLAKENFDFIANCNFGSFAWFGKFFKLDAAFHLVAYVDDGLARFDRDNLAFDNRTLFGRVHFEAFVQECFKLVHHIRHVAYRIL